MELWLDSCHFALIAEAFERGILHGVTTNPTLLAGSPYPPLETLEKLLSIQNGPVTAQVTEKKAQEMIAQGGRLHKISDRLIVKVPVTFEGLKAIHTLSADGITVMATCIYDPLQAYLAFKAGALYAATYVGRMEEAGLDAFDALQTMKDAVKAPCKVMAASIRSEEQITKCLKAQIGALTLGEKAFRHLLEDHPLTTKNCDAFNAALSPEWI